MSEARAADDLRTDRNPVLGDLHRPGAVASLKLPNATNVAAKPPRRGRPKRADAPNVPWPAVDVALVHGERHVDPKTGHEVLRYPSLAVLAERYGVSRTLMWKFARRHNCFDRRKEAQARTLARTDEKVIEKVSSAQAAATVNVVGIVDEFLRGFEKELREGRVRTDSPSDFDRLTRLRELVTGGPDSRSELRGELTLEAIQARHRRLRGQVEAMTPQLAGTTSEIVGEGDAQGGLGGEERGGGPAH